MMNIDPTGPYRPSRDLSRADHRGDRGAPYQKASAI
jgi:hypothetical protein